MDLPGEKLLIKLWETLAEKGVGSLLTPWQTIREGRARNEVRRQELLMLAQAELDAADVRAGRKRFDGDGALRQIGSGSGEASLSNSEAPLRIEPTLDFRSLAEVSMSIGAAEAARNQINASKALIYAEELLANDSQLPPEREVEGDWLFTWRDYAGKVSTEDLQKLWGSVLAGEVKSPGTYSLRTLEFLKGLSKSEAEQIAKLASFAVEGRIVRSQKQYLEEQGISFGMLLQLQELGVVSGVEAVGLTTTYKTLTPERFVSALRSNGKVLVVEHEDPSKVMQLEVYMLTGVGAQLLGLGNFEPDIQYLRLIGKQLASQGFKVRLADWLQVSEKEGRYFNEETVDA